MALSSISPLKAPESASGANKNNRPTNQVQSFGNVRTEKASSQSSPAAVTKQLASQAAEEPIKKKLSREMFSAANDVTLKENATQTLKAAADKVEDILGKIENADSSQQSKLKADAKEVINQARSDFQSLVDKDPGIAEKRRFVVESDEQPSEDKKTIEIQVNEALTPDELNFQDTIVDQAPEQAEESIQAIQSQLDTAQAGYESNKAEIRAEVNSGKVRIAAKQVAEREKEAVETAENFTNEAIRNSVDSVVQQGTDLAALVQEYVVKPTQEEEEVSEDKASALQTEEVEEEEPIAKPKESAQKSDENPGSVAAATRSVQQ